MYTQNRKRDLQNDDPFKNTNQPTENIRIIQSSERTPGGPFPVARRQPELLYENCDHVTLSEPYRSITFLVSATCECACEHARVFG